MENLFAAVMSALSPMNLLYLMIGSIIGLIIGVLPGLGPVFATALVLPFTFGLEPAPALIVLAAV